METSGIKIQIYAPLTSLGRNNAVVIKRNQYIVVLGQLSMKWRKMRSVLVVDGDREGSA